MIEPASFRVLQYQTADHRRPFEKWLNMKKDYVPPAVPYRDYMLKRLHDPATAAAYLNEAASDSDPAAFLQALRNVVDASGGITKIAARTDLNRQAVYRMLSEQGNPEFRSLQKLLSAAGLGLNVVTAEQKRAAYRVRGRALGKRRKESPASHR